MHILAFILTVLPVKAEDFERLSGTSIKHHTRIWRIIGSELGIDVEILKSIQRNHINDKDCLHAMINGANPAPTQELITKVLQSTNITNAISGRIL